MNIDAPHRAKLQHQCYWNMPIFMVIKSILIVMSLPMTKDALRRMQYQVQLCRL